MNTLDKVYNHDLDTSSMLDTKDAIRRLLIEQYDNLVDAPEELTSILESTSECLTIYKHLHDKVKFTDSQYTDSMFALTLKKTIGQITDVLNSTEGHNFLSDKWYKKDARPLLEQLNDLAKHLQAQFVAPKSGGSKMTF